MSDWQSLAKDEMFSTITLLLRSLLKHSRCLLTTGGREIVRDPNSRGIIYDLWLPLRGEQGTWYNCWALCACLTCVGKAACSFSAQSKSGWTETTWASGRCTLQKHWERNGENDWLGKESFQKLNVHIHYAFSSYKAFCLLSFVTLHYLWDATVPLLRKAYKSLFTQTSSTTP